MEQNNLTPEGRDPQLWEIAQKRAKFKRHFITYIVVNAFLWAIWYFNYGNIELEEVSRYPWPIWPTLGWGIGVALQYADAYMFPKGNTAENEYEKLKRERERK